MRSIMRTVRRVPGGIRRFAGGCWLPFVPVALEEKFDGLVDMALSAIREPNFNDATSSRSNFCIVAPTWKLMSFSEPPINLPLIRLPFFSSKESAQASDAAKQRTPNNAQLSFNFIHDLLAFLSLQLLFLTTVIAIFQSQPPYQTRQLEKSSAEALFFVLWIALLSEEAPQLTARRLPDAGTCQMLA